MGMESVTSGKSREDVVVSAQLHGIGREIGHLGLNHVYTTQPGTTIRSASFYRDRKLFGAVDPIFGNSVALLLASQTQEVPLRRVLVAPTQDGSGLFKDNRGRPHTDSFIEVEGQTVRHVRTTQPVELAGVYGYEPGRPEFELAEPDITGRFARVTNHKDQIKQILAAAGINVPRGIHITDLTDTDTVLDQCRTFHQDLAEGDRQRDIVLKPESETTHGDHVVMGNPGDGAFIDSARETVRQARKMGLSVIVEERIDSAPQPGLAEYNKQLCLAAGTPEDRIPTANELDLSFRVLFTVGEDPIFIDDELRYDNKGKIPVNVGKSAAVVRTDVIDPGEVTKVRETVKQSIAAVYRHVKEIGDPEALPEMVGGDCTIDRDGKVYVWELQWGPSGVGSLTKIDKEPTTSIGRVFVPYLEAILASRQAQSGHEEAALSQIPHTFETKDALFFELYDSGRFREAEILWWANFDLHPTKFTNETKNLSFMDILAEQTGHYQRALEYATALVNDEPGNEGYQEYKSKFEAGKKLSEIDKLMAAGEHAKAHDEFYHSDLLPDIWEHFGGEKLIETMESIAIETGWYLAPSEVTAQLVEQEPENETFQRVHRKFEAGVTLNRVMEHLNDEEYAQAHELFYYSDSFSSFFEDFDDEILVTTMEDIARGTGFYIAASEVTAQLIEQEPGNENFQRVHRKFEAGAALQHVGDHIEDGEYTAAHDRLYASQAVLETAFTTFDNEQILGMMATIAGHTGEYRLPLNIAQQLVRWDSDNTTYQRFLTEFQKGFDIAAINAR